MNPEPDPKTQPLFLTVGECANGGEGCKQQLEGVETVPGSHVIAYITCARADCPVIITASTPLELLGLKKGESAYWKIKAALEQEQADASYGEEIDRVREDEDSSRL